MDDIEVRVKEIIAQYGDLTQGGEPQTQEFKKTVQAFIEQGPACPNSGARHCSGI